MVFELSQRGNLVVEDQMVRGPVGFDSYSLFSLQKDWVEPGRDNLTTDMLLELIHEPLLNWSANPETWGQRQVAQPAQEWLAGLGVRLVDLDYVDHDRLSGIPDEHWRLSANMGDDDHEAFLALRETLQNVYDGFSIQQKSVSTYLTNIYGHFLICSMCLAAGQLSPEQYGVAVAVGQMVGLHEPELFDEQPDLFDELAGKVLVNAQRAIDYIELSS